MSPKTDSQDPFFTPLSSSLEIPKQFTFLRENIPNPLCLLAAIQLQTYLSTQRDWQHNFGIKPGQVGTIIGKMFGVLVVQTSENELGYLAAFSGKLAVGNHHSKFVPRFSIAFIRTAYLTMEWRH